MVGHFLDKIRALRGPTIALREQIPDAWGGFAQLNKQALADGALSTKTKELIALAISVAEGCDGCIAYHASGAVRAGATEKEAAEAIGVALLMRGGPATDYGPRALEAVREFRDRRSK